MGLAWRRAEEPGKAGVAPASLNDMRRSEKPNRHNPIIIQGLKTPRTSNHTFAYKHTLVHHAHHHAASAGGSTVV